MALNSERDASSRYQTEIEQIENISDTKGVDIDDINVKETTSDSGDDIVLFRVHSEDGPKVQITKMDGVETAQMTFRNDVQNKISALKRHIAGGGEPDEPEPVEQSDSDGSARTRDRSRSRPRPSGDGPGSQLDAEIEAIHDRLDELEDRIEELETKSEALDGLQQLMQGDE